MMDDFTKKENAAPKDGVSPTKLNRNSGLALRLLVAATDRGT
jgi:hypothetical protein